jgi:hypothetical protein
MCIFRLFIQQRPVTTYDMQRHLKQKYMHYRSISVFRSSMKNGDSTEVMPITKQIRNQRIKWGDA